MKEDAVRQQIGAAEQRLGDLRQRVSAFPVRQWLADEILRELLRVLNDL